MHAYDLVYRIQFSIHRMLMLGCMEEDSKQYMFWDRMTTLDI